MSDDILSRRALAKLVDMHPDSLSRDMANGLGGAVLRWGGRGKETMFSRPLALRWAGAWACRQRRGGEECPACWRVLEDMQAVAAHLSETRHGYGGCQECGATWELSQPCRPLLGEDRHRQPRRPRRARKA